MVSKPNILLFMTDHQRADVIGMRQCGREVTPNLNRLARMGFQFDRAYDTCPLCVPARTALATGLYPTKNAVVYNDWKGITAGEYEPVHAALKKAGYRVGHAGVDHIRIQPPMRQQGLDFFVNQEDYEEWAAGRGLKTARNQDELIEVLEEIDGKYVNKRYSGHKVSLWDKPAEQFKDFYFLEKSLEFLRGTGEEPFALFTYLWAPHPPFRIPEPYAGMYKPEDIILPDNIGIPAEQEPALRRKGVPAQLARGITGDQWRRVWAAHLGLTTMADEIFGRVIKELESMGKLDNTCIIFTSDHGDHLGQHSMYQKMEMYEEAVRVPLIVKMPGRKPGRSDGVVTHLDIKPTICEAAGIENGGGDGVSLLPVIEGAGPDRQRIVYSQYSGNPGYGTVRRAAISERYKYVFDSSYEKELYDLEADPHEMKNVAGDEAYQEILMNMHQACRRFHEEHGDYFKWEQET